MAYRKFSADSLFTGREMLGSDRVLITDGRGTVIDILHTSDAGDGIEVLNGILSPGFINYHCHLELSYLKGAIPMHTGMVPFLLTVMSNRGANREQVQAAIADAEQEMVANGIVAVGDICNTADTLIQKQRGNMLYHNFVEAAGFADTAADTRFRQALEIYERFPEPRSIVPHAPYSVSGSLFRLLNDFDKRSLLSIHNQESEAENEFFERGTGSFVDLYRAIGLDISGFSPPGVSSLRSYINQFAMDRQLILVHNTATSADDVTYLQQRRDLLPDLFFCLCPEANLYINNMVSDIPMLAGSGFKIVVGTDSLASNTQLNILEELKTIQRQFPSFDSPALLQWATLNGAEALLLDEVFGSFERGKTPGLVLIRNASGRLHPEATCSRIL